MAVLVDPISVYSGRAPIEPEQGRTDLTDPATASAARLPVPLTGSVSDPARLHVHGKTAGQRTHGNQEPWVSGPAVSLLTAAAIMIKISW
jgi:hypothetical protein